MSQTTPNKSLILEEIQNSGGNLSRVARSLGLEYHALRQRYGSAPVVPFRTAVGPEPEDITTLGKPGVEQYVVAVKRAGDAWPDKYAAIIADARRKFDAGTHEMFQSNNSGWVVQYLIPYLVPVARRTFFSTMVKL